MAVARRTMARSDVFAHVNLPRLGETCKNRPRLKLELSLRRRALVLSEVLSRSGERGSPKRERVVGKSNTSLNAEARF